MDTHFSQEHIMHGTLHAPLCSYTCTCTQDKITAWAGHVGQTPYYLRTEIDYLYSIVDGIKYYES